MSKSKKSKRVVGITECDFTRHFPEKHWISDWGEDDEYPEGFCYKLLTTRDVQTKKTEVVLILAQANGDKQEMLRATIPSGDLDAFAKTMTNDLSERYGLDFQEQDYSRVRTFDEFKEVSKRFGWTWKTPDTA
jgi:hypothetical protein